MDLRWPLRISEERVVGVLVLVLTGRLTAASAAGFAAAVTEALDRGDVRLVVDLGGVDYVSSAGLRALAAAEGQCTRARGGLCLCRLTEPVTIALDLGGLLSQLSIEPTREEAIRRVVTPPGSSGPHA
jgi:anti-sigma B factor antagonist